MLTQPTRPLQLAVLSRGDDEAVARRAAELAAELYLPHVLEEPSDEGAAAATFDAFLAVTPARLEVQFPGARGLRPLFVDFAGGRFGYSRRSGGARLLLQAIGCRSGRPSVLDATAGLGRDLFVMAHHGCRVFGVERSPVLFALLRDGLKRAALDADIRRRIPDPVRLIHADARDVLCAIVSAAHVQAARDDSCSVRGGEEGSRASLDAPDVVYLDPMYPAAPKSALSKIEMRLLRSIVGNDADANELMDPARAAARKRVVVKRHRRAAPLAPRPSYQLSDKSTRYDIYLTAARD